MCRYKAHLNVLDDNTDSKANNPLTGAESKHSLGDAEVNQADPREDSEALSPPVAPVVAPGSDVQLQASVELTVRCGSAEDEAADKDQHVVADAALIHDSGNQGHLGYVMIQQH